jgi:hypothetical protein
MLVAPVHVKPQLPLLHVGVLLAGCGHELQTAPALPHWVGDSLVYMTQLPPTVLVQQPLGHDVPSQTHCPVLLLHSWFAPQAEHEAPPTPHEEPDCAA